MASCQKGSMVGGFLFVLPLHDGLYTAACSGCNVPSAHTGVLFKSSTGDTARPTLPTLSVPASVALMGTPSSKLRGAVRMPGERGLRTLRRVMVKGTRMPGHSRKGAWGASKQAGNWTYHGHAVLFCCHGRVECELCL